MDPEIKIIRQRMSVLELAEAFGNVAEEYRQRCVLKTQFYEYKRRFKTHGLVGLKDLSPIHHSHPLTTPPNVEARILALSLEYPAWGFNRLSDHLALDCISVSAPTILRILNDNDMGTGY